MDILATEALASHHGSKPPKYPMSQQWTCRYCQIGNAQQATHCRGCYGHWQEVWDQKPRSVRKPSLSQKRKNQQAGHRKDGQTRDPMMPFGPASTAQPPWTSSTPTTRMAKPAVEKETDLPPSPSLPKPPKAPGQQGEKEETEKNLQAIKDILGDRMTKEIEDAVKGTAAEPKLTNGLMHRVSNAQKAMTKAKQKVAELDSTFVDLQKILKQRYETQKEAYLAQRKPSRHTEARS